MDSKLGDSHDKEDAGNGDAGPAPHRRSRRATVAVWGAIGTIVIGVATAAATNLARGPARDVEKALSSSPPPLTVVAREMSPGPTCAGGGRGWVFSRSPSQLPTPPEDIDSWAAKYGGVPAEGNLVEAILQGTSEHAVVITALSIEVVHRRPPLTGAYVDVAGQCGGLEPDYYKVDLDQRSPVVTAAVGEEAEGRPGALVRPVPFPHQLSAKDAEVWRIKPRTDMCYCEWVGIVHWTSDGRQGTLRIDHGGQPFRTSTVAKSHPVLPRGSHWEPNPRAKTNEDTWERWRDEAATHKHVGTSSR